MTGRRESGTPFLLSLGSNVGDRRAHLEGGLSALAQRVRIEAVSRVVESEPWGPVPQRPYLNLVVRGRTAGDVRDLLSWAREAETLEGRARGPAEIRWGPRVLDVDVLFFGDRVLDDVELTVPHPRWRERPFVYGLIGDVAGDLVEPRTRVLLRDVAPFGPLPVGLVEKESILVPESALVAAKGPR